MPKPETDESAFTRVATTDADGKALFTAYKVAGGEDYRPAPSADSSFLGSRSVPTRNEAHHQLMMKAQALVEKVAKSGAGNRRTIEQAYERVLTDPSNRALARAALRPGPFLKTANEDEDEDDGDSQSENDGSGNTAHNARSAVIGRLSGDASKTGRPASATRTFSLGGRKEKIAARVQKFLAMCPNASDDEALGYALSRKRTKKALEVRLRAG